MSKILSFTHNKTQRYKLIRVFIVLRMAHMPLLLNILCNKMISHKCHRSDKNFCNPFMNVVTLSLFTFLVSSTNIMCKMCLVIFDLFVLLTGMQENFWKLCVSVTTLLKIMSCHYFSSYGTCVRGRV